MPILIHAGAALCRYRLRAAARYGVRTSWRLESRRRRSQEPVVRGRVYEIISMGMGAATMKGSTPRLAAPALAGYHHLAPPRAMTRAFTAIAARRNRDDADVISFSPSDIVAI